MRDFREFIRCCLIQGIDAYRPASSLGKKEKVIKEVCKTVKSHGCTFVQVCLSGTNILKKIEKQNPDTVFLPCDPFFVLADGLGCSPQPVAVIRFLLPSFASCCRSRCRCRCRRPQPAAVIRFLLPSSAARFLCFRFPQECAFDRMIGSAPSRSVRAGRCFRPPGPVRTAGRSLRA